MIRPLAEIPLNHPCVFGQSQVLEPQPLLVYENATVLPRVSTHRPGVWAGRWSQGIFDANSQHIEELNDRRGNRNLFFPKRELKDNIDLKTTSFKLKKIILYGGTLYEHFGDMLADTNRAYQLLRHYRTSKQKVWFHYAVPRLVRKIRKPTILEWINCLGLNKRVQLIRKPIRAEKLISCSQIHRDLHYTQADYHEVARAALDQELAKQLTEIVKAGHRVAYLARDKLRKGTTKFIGEPELIERIKTLENIDIIRPEELDISAKLALWRRYSLIIGFPQSCMLLKPFVPCNEIKDLAQQVFLIAGPNCLPTTWVNIDKACGFGDFFLDCIDNQAKILQIRPEGFTRGNNFDIEKAFRAIERMRTSMPKKD